MVGDVLDRKALTEALSDVGAVIHLAAKKAVGESVSNPLKYYQHNVGGTLNLLAGMSTKGVRKLVFSSTAAVYSPSKKESITEEDETQPLSPYGATKLLSEKLISEVSKSEGLSSVSLRYFNVVGSSKLEFGDNSKDNLVPKVFAALANGERPEIYGDDAVGFALESLGFSHSGDGSGARGESRPAQRGKVLLPGPGRARWQGGDEVKQVWAAVL